MLISASWTTKGRGAKPVMVPAFAQGAAFYCGAEIGVNESCSSDTKNTPALLLLAPGTSLPFQARQSLKG